MNFDKELITKWSQDWPKGAASQAVEDAVKADKNVIVLAADLAGAIGVDGCAKYEGQYFNLGIAEQNMMGVAAGLALSGKTPLTTSFVPFLTLRACEQIRTGICYMNLNVKFLGNNAGVRGGKAGVSHWGLEDITVMRSFPNMTVFSPCDGVSLYKCIRKMFEIKGPAYVRMSGCPTKKVIYDGDYELTVGKANKLLEGEDVAILATGSVVENAMDAAALLKDKGINVSLYDFQTVKPLDVDTVKKVIAENKLVVTVEENTIIGGFGSAVAEVAAGIPHKAVIDIKGLQDTFMGIAPYDVLLKKCGLSAEQIAESIVEKL